MSAQQFEFLLCFNIAPGFLTGTTQYTTQTKQLTTDSCIKRQFKVFQQPDRKAHAAHCTKPSDGQPPASVGFVQCAGSRDENHLPYCSAVCCTASLKHATYLRSQYPGVKIRIFYIDVRTPGRLEHFYTQVAEDPDLELSKGKVAKVEEDPATHDLLVTAEDVLQGRRITHRFSMLVLATGLVPRSDGLPDGFTRDEFGFVQNTPNGGGLYGAGCARRPEEVSASIQDATGAALKALRCVVRSAHHG